MGFLSFGKKKSKKNKAAKAEEAAPAESGNITIEQVFRNYWAFLGQILGFSDNFSSQPEKTLKIPFFCLT